MKASQPTPMMTVAATFEPNEFMAVTLFGELICFVFVSRKFIRVWL